MDQQKYHVLANQSRKTSRKVGPNIPLRRIRNEIQTNHQMIDRLLIGWTSIFYVRNRSKRSALRARQVDSYPFISSIAYKIVVTDNRKLPVNGDIVLKYHPIDE